MKSKAIIAILGAALFSVIGNVSIRFADLEISALSISVLRISIGLLFLLLFFGKNSSPRKFLSLNIKDKTLLLLLGVFFWAFAIYFSTLAIVNTHLGNVSSISAFQPFVVYIFSLVMLGYTFNWRMTVLVLLSIYGVLAISNNSLIPNLNSFGRGELFAVISVLLFSLGFIARKMLTESLAAYEISIATMALAIPPLFILALATHQLPNLQTITTVGAAGVLGTGFSTSFISFLNNYALGYLPPALVSQISLLKVVLAFIAGFILFAEIPNLYTIIGSVLIIVSVYISARFKL